MADKDIRAELIDKFARMIVDNNLEELARTYLDLYKPVSRLGGAFIFIPGFVFFEVLGAWTHEIGNMLIDNPETNIDRILTRIDELEQEKLNLKTEESRDAVRRDDRSFSIVDWIKRKVRMH